MTPNDPSETRCPGPGCHNTLAPKAGSGRPRLYCSDACGARYRKTHPRTDTTADVAGAADAADDLAASVARLREAIVLGDAESALRAYLECEKAIKETRRALVALGRGSKMKNSEIAASLHVSTATVNRMATAAGRRDRTTAPAPVIPAPRVRHPGTAPSRPLRPAGGTGGIDGGGPPGRPAALFTSALSYLQRSSRKPYKTLAHDAQVDPSYISRILSGERIPSWPVTRRITLSCGGDPAELRPLWDTARGYRAAQPDTLHAALRGLHLAAAQPDLDILQTRTHLSTDDIAAALQGDRLPDWPVIDRLVTALHGQPDTIRPLWDAARATTPAQPALTTCTIPTGAFG